MSETFSILAASSKDTGLVLPKTFLAPNLRHLKLLGINRPKRFRLLSSTTSLVSLALTHNEHAAHAIGSAGQSPRGKSQPGVPYKQKPKPLVPIQDWRSFGLINGKPPKRLQIW